VAAPRVPGRAGGRRRHDPAVRRGGLSFPLPELFGSELLGLLAVVAAVAGSVALGRRGAASPWVRWLVVTGNAVLAVVALAITAELAGSEAYDD
jgi:hypothetical protein